jgi:hypothetical protein
LDAAELALVGAAISHSFKEHKLSEETLRTDPEMAPAVIAYSRHKLLRIYPKATRILSGNYDPQPSRNCGCQLVALNYQYKDRHVWLDQGFFSANGKSGYVLKPEYMREHQCVSSAADDGNGSSTTALPPPAMTPTDFSPARRTAGPLRIRLTIISAHFLPKCEGRQRMRDEIIDPFVTVGFSGVAQDCTSVETSVIPDNGFNPQWHETFEFNLEVPEMATMLVVVRDKQTHAEHMVECETFIGQYAVPVLSMRCGYRSMPLRRKSGVEIPDAYLLLRMKTY